MKNLKVIIAILALIFATSCETYYRMITVLDKNGNAYREIYTHGNKAFMCGDNVETPFLFDLDSTWCMHRLDSAIHYNFFGETEMLNVKVSKRATSIEKKTKNMCYDENKRSFAAPEESLVKKTDGFIQNIHLK
jgi:hypothetical protein